MRAKFKVTIEYEGDIVDDPQCYEGASTPQERVEKEREYLAEDGDYLFQTMAMLKHTTDVEITPIDSDLCTVDECLAAPRCSSGATVWHTRTDACLREANET